MRAAAIEALLDLQPELLQGADAAVLGRASSALRAEAGAGGCWRRVELGGPVCVTQRSASLLQAAGSGGVWGKAGQTGGAAR